MNTLQIKWREYRDGAIPEHASERQLDAMRKAFYAGVASTLDLIAEIGESASSNDIVCRALEAICDECDAFTSVKN